MLMLEEIRCIAVDTINEILHFCFYQSGPGFIDLNVRLEGRGGDGEGIKMDRMGESRELRPSLLNSHC